MLPQVNTLVRVAVGDGPDPDDGLRASDVPSRVEDVEDTGTGPRRILIATPHFRGDAEEPTAGTACSLTWTAQDGVVVLPVAFDRAVSWTVTWPTEEAGLLRLWWVTVRGDIERVQRREYFRCPLSVPVRLAPEGGEPVTGRTTDLGEGGLRCLLEGAAPPVGTEVGATLDLHGGTQLSLAGTVLRSDRADGAPGHWDTAVRFDDPEARGDEIRRLIFSEQLRLHRLGLA